MDERDATAIETDDAVRACLNDFVWAYANIDGESSGLNEVELFQVWLRATTLLRLNLPAPPRAMP